MIEPRVAFVNYIPFPSRWPGLAHKLRQQAEAAQRSGIVIDVIVIAREVLPPSALMTIPGASGLSRIQGRFSEVRKAVIKRDYQAVVLRYANVSDPSFLWCWRGAHPPVITEHHTKQVEELRLLATNLRGRLRLAAEELLGPSLLSRAAGLIGVTDSIRASQVARLHNPPPSTVVSNGVCVDLVSMRSGTLTADTLEVVVSAADFSPWHGLDRLLNGLLTYRGRVPVTLHVIGNLTCINDRATATEITTVGRARVICHGRLDAAAQDRIFNTCHGAISSLALHRLGMNDGSPLKSREYAARGIPFAYAYDDPDFNASAPGTLRLPADESVIDWDHLVQFFQSQHGNVCTQLRNFARSHLDWSLKMRAMHAFAVSCT